MAVGYTIPLVYANTGDLPIEGDLSLALVFWAIEDKREKGGGFFRKKDAEHVTQVALLYRPVLVAKYKGSSVALDGCGTTSTQFRFGVAPSLTNLRNYLISDAWETKPESYAAGLDLQSRDFEKALDEHNYVIPGWITDPKLLGQLGDLLELSTASEEERGSLPQAITFDSARQSFEELDSLKRQLAQEIAKLHGLELELAEKTTEVLAPLREEYSKIENQYDKRIEAIRPSVTENQQRYQERQRKEREQITERIDEQLSDLKERLAEVNAKVDAYESEQKVPRGGIERQYSLRGSIESQIGELGAERRDKVGTLDEKYDALIAQEQERIDSLEEAKQKALKEPGGRIKKVGGSTERLKKAFNALVKGHESVLALGEGTVLALPKQIDRDEFVARIPIIIAKYQAGARKRSAISSVSVMKASKGMTDSFKGFVGMKQSPLEKENPSLVVFAQEVIEDARLDQIIPSLASSADLLQTPQTRGLIVSGVAKLQGSGWIKPKDAESFLDSIKEDFEPLKPGGLPMATPPSTIPRRAESTVSNPRIRVLNFEGKESLVQLSELAEVRRLDEEEFNKGSPGMRSATGESTQLVRHLKSVRFPYDKEYCVKKGEIWVQNQLYFMLANSQFRARVRKEHKFESKEVESRIDFDVSGIGVEVKIFREQQDLQRLAEELVRYTREYNEIIIPYINSGFSDERLYSEFRFLKEKFKEIRDYFELNCADIER